MTGQEFRQENHYLSFNEECEMRADSEPQIQEDEKVTSQNQSSEDRPALMIR